MDMLGALGKQVEQYLPGAKMQVAKLADKAKVRGGKKKKKNAWALRCAALLLSAAAFRCCALLLLSVLARMPLRFCALALGACRLMSSAHQNPAMQSSTPLPSSPRAAWRCLDEPPCAAFA